MRKLTTKQKNLLFKFLLANEPSEMTKLSGAINPIREASDLPDEIWDKLKAINDTEVLYQEVNLFIDYWRNN